MVEEEHIPKYDGNLDELAIGIGCEIIGVSLPIMDVLGDVSGKSRAEKRAKKL